MRVVLQVSDAERPARKHFVRQIDIQHLYDQHRTVSPTTSTIDWWSVAALLYTVLEIAFELVYRQDRLRFRHLPIARAVAHQL